ncbi:hypothetical protein FACS189490_12410 [Clostridia bacterium]|nr:hypothetical protein FACS189490_12410 [Clostridia bacterium]
MPKKFENDYILLCADNAPWHKSEALIVPDNIRLFYIPPYTPEMNPIEQTWKEIRKSGFKNTLFKTLGDIVDKRCDSINALFVDVIKSVTCRDWIDSMF